MAFVILEVAMPCRIAAITPARVAPVVVKDRTKLT